MIKREWSQKTLAQALGKHRTAVNRWLNGNRAPDYLTCIHIQQVLGIEASAWGQPPVEPFVPPATWKLVPPEAA
ncbi:helix-turn-helix domain-containing protein [Sorangium sp. So ce131]|uniref:helix-turn-helix domain-containing protein n=1 Tax=Sorangium sp. So ce131 TaxID=3133282 RepID=UPI003F643C30